MKKFFILLFITTIKPRSIIVGKMLAAVMLTMMIFSACLPFLTFTYFLRGIDLPSMAVVLALGFVAVTLAAQVAIFIACLPVGRAFKFILGLIAFSQLVSGFMRPARVRSPRWSSDASRGVRRHRAA